MSDEAHKKPGAGRIVLILLAVLAIIAAGGYFAFRQSVLSSAVETVRTARKHMGDGNTAAAKQSIEWLRHFDPKNQSALLIEAAVLKANGDSEQAGNIVERIDPSRLELADCVTLATLLESANKLDQAEAALLRYTPESAEAVGPLVRLYLKELRVPDAVKLYRSHWQSNKNDRATLLSLLELITANPSSDAYVPQLKQIDEVEPNQQSVTLSLAQAAAERGDNTEARKRFETALAADPDNIRARLLAARFFVDLGELENATQLLTFEENNAPKHEDQFWYLKSRLAEANGNTSQAVSDLDHAIKLFPSEPYLQLKARLLRSTGKVQEAIKVTQQCADFAAARQELEQLYGQANTQRFSPEYCKAVAERLVTMQYHDVAEAWRSLAK